MRKTNLLALSAVAAFLATSCSKDQVSETNPGNAIRFKTFTSASSKATDVATANLQDFTVAAFTSDNALYFKDAYANNGSGSYLPDRGDHYWPTGDGALTFVGYSPADISNVFDNGQDGATPPQVDISTLASASIANIRPLQHASEQVDLLAFRSTGNSTANASTGVSLYMHHAFSKVTIQAVNDNPGMKVDVIGVKIVGLNGTGKFTLPANTTSAQGLMSNRWSELSTPNSYIAGATSGKQPVTLSTTASAPTNLMFDEGAFMLIPQSFSAWDGTESTSGVYIAVLCQISNDNGSGTYTQLFPDVQGSYGYAAVGVNASWEPGKAYTYTLRFFNNGGGGGIQPPIDPTEPPTEPTPDPGEPGQPVLGGPISFTVTVHDWQNQNATERPMGGGQ